MTTSDPMSCDAFQSAMIDALSTGDDVCAPALMAHRASCAECDGASEELQVVWHRLGSISGTMPAPELDGAQRGARSGRLLPFLAAAAGVVLFLGAGWWLRPDPQSTSQFALGSSPASPLTEVSRLRNESSSESTDSLIAALSSPVSVGVRLVAVSSLEPRASETRVANALREALGAEPSPHVQLALLRLIGPEQGETALSNFLQRDDLDPVVREVATTRMNLTSVGAPQ